MKALYTLFIMVVMAFNMLAFADVEVYVDPTNSLSVDKVSIAPQEAWKEVDSHVFSLPPGSGTVWIKIKKEHIPSELDAIQINYPSINVANAYYMKGYDVISEIRSGLDVAFLERPILGYSPAFPVSIGSDWDSLLVKTYTNAPVQIPVVFTTKLEIQENLLLSNAVSAIYIGLMLGAALACTILSEIMGKIAQLAYSFHCIISAAAIAMLHYYPTSIISPNSASEWAPHMVMALSLVYCLSFLFILDITTGRTLAIFRKPLFWITAVSIIGILAAASLVTLSPLVITLSHSMGAMVLLFAVVILVLNIHRAKNARQFLFALGLTNIGFLLFAAQSMGYIEGNTITRFSLQIGSLCEVVALVLILRTQVRDLSDAHTEAEVALERTKIEALAHKEREALAHKLGKLEELGWVAVRLGDRINTPLQVLKLVDEDLFDSAEYLEKTEKKTSEELKGMAEMIESSIDRIHCEISALQKFKAYAPKNALKLTAEETTCGDIKLSVR